jgi:hypothetical protein
VAWQRSVSPASLVGAILSDRRAALLAYGLSALDPETLRYLIAHPPVLARLYEHDAAVFAVFASSLRIRQERVVPPGGDRAVALWEGVLDEQVTRPDRFLRALYGSHAGRRAYLYDTIASLDPARAAFALGLWMRDGTQRFDRFKALAEVADQANAEWRIEAYPFTRPTLDLAALLMSVRAEPDGAPAPPAWAQLYEKAFDSADLPDDPARAVRKVDEGGAIDAAWLGEHILRAGMDRRLDRLEIFSFGQRVFSSAPRSALPDVLVVLRALVRYPALMLTLERMGLRDPQVFVLAARHAERLGQLDANEAVSALQQFQGSLVLLARMGRAGRIDVTASESLVKRLAAVALDDDGRYDGAMAEWFGRELVPQGDVNPDEAISEALAGVSERRGPAPLVAWEGRQYRVDPAASDLRRLRRLREKQVAVPLAMPLLLWRQVSRLRGGLQDLAQVQAVADAIAKIPAPPRPAKGMAVVVPGTDRPPDAVETLRKAVHELRQIKRPKDVKKAADVAEPLARQVDVWMGQALAGWVYTLAIGEPESTVLLGGEVSQRHDFGFQEFQGETRLRVPWMLPVERAAIGVPWHVRGSLLGLDVSLAGLSLRRLSGEQPPAAPRLSENDHRVFVQSFGLLDAMRIERSGAGALAAAVARGRQRVVDLPKAADTLDTVADDAGLDGWRRRALEWSLQNDPSSAPTSYFSMTELLALGKPDATVQRDALGMSSLGIDGCLCLALQPPGRHRLVVGKVTGQLASVVPDLHLRVAEVLHELSMPPGLVPAVLSGLLLDYLQGVAPSDANDWLTLVRSAQAVSRESIEDSIATLTADGPMIPAEAGVPGAGGRR